MGAVRIGTAGWAYKDWEGIVYPPGLKRTQHPAEYLARYFDVIEINTSFYGPIKPDLAKMWSRKVAAVNPEFQFTAKLYKAFTHAPGGEIQPTSAATLAPTEKDEREVKEGLEQLAESGRLGALLMQFPISLKNTPENRDYLARLLRRFEEYPRVVEVRHASWNNEEILRSFTENGVSFCNIDQPLLGRAIKPTAHATAPIGYVRLHGRNYDQWFEHEKPHDRYNYLYSEGELAKWKPRIEEIARKTEVTYVVANNHFEGKAAVNGLQLKHMLTGRKVKAPQVLVERYPELRPISEI
ncbi:MAG TPA: DUF72 domain-containing protein [Terriglobales bacterium]|nr:DUF72 domain-containing protein [Terriglobales bacterium]